MTNARFLEVDDVAKSFDGVSWTPAPVSFTMDVTSRIVIIEGDNGTGKTTLLRIITGEETATRGAYRWMSNTPYTVLYQTEGILPHTTVRNNLRIVTPSSDSIVAALSEVGLPEDALPQLAGSLSGGEERRLQLARCVLSQRQCWILDEPTSHGDTSFHDVLLKMLTQHVQHDGYAIIVTYDNEFRRQLESAFSGMLAIAVVQLTNDE